MEIQSTPLSWAIIRTYKTSVSPAHETYALEASREGSTGEISTPGVDAHISSS